MGQVTVTPGAEQAAPPELRHRRQTDRRAVCLIIPPPPASGRLSGVIHCICFSCAKERSGLRCLHIRGHTALRSYSMRCKPLGV